MYKKLVPTYPKYILNNTITLGTQDYDTDKNEWPVNKPITKLDAIKQTSGEAEYCNDLPPYPREVFCAFVLTEVGNGKIDSIDASKALSTKGVVAFFSQGHTRKESVHFGRQQVAVLAGG